MSEVKWIFLIIFIVIGFFALKQEYFGHVLYTCFLGKLIIVILLLLPFNTCMVLYIFKALCEHLAN